MKRKFPPFAALTVGLSTLLAIGSTRVEAETKIVPERNEIETKYTWNTNAIFPSIDAWETEYKALQKGIDKVAACEGTLTASAENLLKFFNTSDDVEARLERLYVYTSLLADQDTRVGENQALKSRALSLYYDYAAKMSWTQPELAAIPEATAKKWMAENKELAIYAQFFDDLWRQKKYILPPDQEKLLALTAEVRGTPAKAYNLLSNADLKYPSIKDEEGNDVELSDSAFYVMMRNPHRKVREAAYRGIVGAYEGMRNTNAALLNGVVQSHILNVKARGYDSCLQAALDGGNIPVDVYNTLINTVNKNLHLLHRYQKIRKRVLKLDDGVKAWDLFAPLTTGKVYEIGYDDGVEMITKALQPLGDEYLSAMKKGFSSRWVDVYPTKGKRSGAYSSGTFLTQPFILLNYHGGYEDMSTTAHEMGHSMHSFFSRGTQPYVYADYDIFCAEVASTCNEVFLQNYVLAHTKDPEMKLHLLGEFLESIRGTIFRQTMFSEFEQKIHEMAEAGQPLTADTLGQTYGEIMKKYYGPAYNHDELVDNYWIRIPHFYYNFYVYKYATSYCAATDIANRISDGEPGSVDAYMSFLKGGCSKYPIDLLKMARVDMTSPEPIENAMKLFESLLDQTEELLEKVK